jgi:hypothetical protein
LLLLHGCDSGPTPCEDLAVQVERDLCAFAALDARPPPTAAAAEIELARIVDPVVRSAATLGWLREHPDVSGNQVGPLCLLLEGSERKACVRRANSPHLHR